MNTNSPNPAAMAEMPAVSPVADADSSVAQGAEAVVPQSTQAAELSPETAPQGAAASAEHAAAELPSAGTPVDSLSFLSTVRPDFWESFN